MIERPVVNKSKQSQSLETKVSIKTPGSGKAKAIKLFIYAAFDDIVENGRVHDAGRVEYVEQHLQAVHELNEEGMGIEGYYLWSLMDNFEWSFGYDKRFGILYVDFDSQERIWKDSAYRYEEIIKSNRSILI
ncbi:family 1 glycosylhydrolase [Priestia flexa]|uniref:family 1 glycosylhydrolase n=1 Tax=Priestia TaxID=2800373 RepID=UPI0008158932|nr:MULTISPECIES: family 1 glycosylhydrolase [Priestia]SCC16233.1 Glycosyl hydrolase family 1 [Priestia flexa]